MNPSLGSHLEICGIDMMVTEIRETFGGKMYVLSYFANGDLKFVTFYAAELEAMGAKKP